MKTSLPFLFVILLSILASSDSLKPTSHYRTPKNVAFGTIGGGSSHHLWVFEILKEMYKRGHNVTFFSRGDQLRFSKKYTMIQTRQVGSDTTFMHHPSILNQFVKRATSPDVAGMETLRVCMSNYTLEFIDQLELFKSEHIDLVICDGFSVSCIDSATYSNLPVMITTAFSYFYDSSAPYINNRNYNKLEPTTRNQSLWERIYRTYIRIPFLKVLFSYRLKNVHNFQRKLGLGPTIESAAKRYNNVPKLINNIYGIEASRKHSSFDHMIGPVLLESYPQLDENSFFFLDNHKNVVYIAFGQHVKGSRDTTKLIFQTLLRLVDEEQIDGIIWAGLDEELIPRTIHTPKRVYTYEDLIHHPDIFIIDWAPQFAILQHSSIKVFITHGGATSLHEALYLGVRLFVYPFFGDQPSNAISVNDIGIGKFMNTRNIKYNEASYNEMYRKLKEVVTDPGNRIQDAVNRYSAYVQIRSMHAITRAADLMEENLFAHDSEGKLNYRKDIGEEIPWIKKNNCDIYIVFAVLAFIIIKIVGYMLFFTKNSIQQKWKVS